MQLLIKNQNRQLCWGTGAFEDICDRLDISLQDFDIMIITNQNKALNELTYSALRNGAEIKDESLDFNYKEFLYWLDQEPQETAEAIMNDFLASRYLGKTMKDRFDEISARLDATEKEETKKPSKKKNIASEK